MLSTTHTLIVTMTGNSGTFTGQATSTMTMSITERLTDTANPNYHTSADLHRNAADLLPCMWNGTCTSTLRSFVATLATLGSGVRWGARVGCFDCLQSFYGVGCRSVCPGGVCPCSNNGHCFDGVKGNGTCQCFANATVGYWDGTSCSECQDGYYGASCTQRCDCLAGNGNCRQGREGTGVCDCVRGWTGVRCDTCSPGYFNNSGRCSTCPGVTSATPEGCNGNGQCDPSTGLCWCVAGFSGDACEVTNSSALGGCQPPRSA